MSQNIRIELNLVDAFKPLGVFNENSHFWDNPHEDTLGSYICGFVNLVAENIQDTPAFDRYITIVKIYDNIIDKAIGGVMDQIKHPFSGTNLYWTIGIVVLIVAVIGIIWYKKKK